MTFGAVLLVFGHLSMAIEGDRLLWKATASHGLISFELLFYPFL